MYFLRLVLPTVKQSSWLVLKRWRKWPPERTQLTKCLEKFHKKSVIFLLDQNIYKEYKAIALRSIKAGWKNLFSIITNPQFLQANKALDAFVKTLRKHHCGEIPCVVNKETLTRGIVENFSQSVLFSLTDTTNRSFKILFGFSFWGYNFVEIFAGAISALDEYFGQCSRFHSNLNKAATVIHAGQSVGKCYNFRFFTSCISALNCVLL